MPYRCYSLYYRPTPSRYNRRTGRRGRRRGTRSTPRFWYGSTRYCFYGPPRRYRRTRFERSDDGVDSSEAEDAKEEELVTKLHVKGVDLNVASNTEAHYTDKYEVPPGELIIRRGQEFNVTFTWDRPYDTKKFDVHLVFTTYTGGSDPSENTGTLAKIKLDESGARRSNQKKWHARLASKEDNKTEVEISTPCNCVIGEWKMKVVTTSLGSDEKICYKHSTEITILFNPWCKDDQCYYKGNIADLNEYILNDMCCQYKGNKNNMFAVGWDLGQFDENQVDICLYLVKQAFNGNVDKRLGDPVKVARGIAKMVNCQDDNGVLVGNWSGDYSGGEKPGSWANSADILNAWANSKPKKYTPVKYGQCWVFSAVTTAVCRAVGLPCRSVTNFASAHDTDGSCTIDKIYDEDGVLIKHETSDSVWNFHVWNEVYFARPDLPKGYDGWQVIDATPQERSDGIFTCGPSPVIAIKKGECTLPFDIPFTFAEVNGDRVSWEKRAPGVYVVSRVDTRSVGQKISTKVPDGEPFKKQRWRSYEDKEHRLDLTLEYKYAEGSEEEHQASLNARIEEALPGDVKDLFVKIEDPGDVMVGDTAEFDIKVTNISRDNEPRTVSSVAITIQSESYDGSVEQIVKQQKYGEISLRPGQRKAVSVRLKPEEYEPYLSDDSMLNIVAMVHCKETGESTSDEDDFRFVKPDIIIQMEKGAKLGEKVPVKLSFNNPLQTRPLTECELVVAVSRGEKIVVPQKSDVKARQPWSDKVTITAKKIDKMQVTAIFKCKELDDIRETCTITVTK